MSNAFVRLLTKTSPRNVATTWTLGLLEGTLSESTNLHQQLPLSLRYLDIIFFWYSELISRQNHVFFYKAHILAGQVQVDGKSVKDFAWLTKEEVGEKVEKDYWHVVKDILSDF